jgi:hypothetical protein
MAARLSALRSSRTLPPGAIVRPEGLGNLEKIHLIGTRSRDLPVCNVVPQPLRYRVPRLSNKRRWKQKLRHQIYLFWFGKYHCTVIWVERKENTRLLTATFDMKLVWSARSSCSHNRAGSGYSEVNTTQSSVSRRSDMKKSGRDKFKGRFYICFKK